MCLSLFSFASGVSDILEKLQIVFRKVSLYVQYSKIFLTDHARGKIGWCTVSHKFDKHSLTGAGTGCTCTIFFKVERMVLFFYTQKSAAIPLKSIFCCFLGVLFQKKKQHRWSGLTGRWVDLNT